MYQAMLMDFVELVDVVTLAGSDVILSTKEEVTKWSKPYLDIISDHVTKYVPVQRSVA